MNQFVEPKTFALGLIGFGRSEGGFNHDQEVFAAVFENELFSRGCVAASV
jgi:hypothetical protein